MSGADLGSREGTVPVGSMRPGDHLCLIFADDAEREEVLGTFLRDGLLRGQKVLYLTAGSRPGPVLSRVARGGTDPRVAQANGQLVVLSGLDSARPGRRRGRSGNAPAKGPVGAAARIGPLVRRLRTELLRSHREGYPALRVTGDLCPAPDGLGAAELAEYEAALEPVFAEGSGMCLCPFDRRQLDAAGLECSRRVHPHAVETDPYFETTQVRITRTFQPSGLRITGCLDADAHASLIRALAEVADASGDLHVDMAGLEFLDLPGLRILISAAQGLGGERRLLLDNLPFHLNRVIRLIGWDTVPGLGLDALPGRQEPP
jgi:anti-anti-sigma regulatory factor